VVLGWTAAFGLLACANIRLAFFGEPVASIWFANGVLLAPLLVAPRSELVPRLALACVAIVVLDVALGRPPAVAALLGVARILEVAMAVLLLRLGADPDVTELQQPRSLARFVVLGCVLPPLASGAVAALGLKLLEGADAAAILRLWYPAHVSGLLIVAPPLLLAVRDGWPSLVESCGPRAGGWALLAVAVIAIAVFSAGSYSFKYLALPPVVLVAFRGGFRASAVGLLLLAVIAIGFTLLGLGPFNLPGSAHPHATVLELQGFLVVAVLTTLPVAAALHQRNELLRRVAEQAAKDGLTGVATRSSFDERAQLLWNDARRRGLMVTLALIDADYFKRYNDLYGHPAGDACLRRIAALLQHAFRRPSDLVARVGGEEFAVLLQGVELDVAAALLDEIHASLALKPIPHSGSPLGRVSVSIGVSSAMPGGPASLEALYQRADQLLYRAKSEGRSRTATGDQKLTSELYLASR
jgi:diguanylate cyclase (GGDEF)-like protein